MIGGPPYYTPSEMAREYGMERRELVQFCLDNGVAIYQGRISAEEFKAARDALPRKQAGE